MTFNISKTTISYMATAALASFLTAIFLNSSLPQPDHCTLCRVRLRREDDKISFCKEEKKKALEEEIEKVILKKAVKDGAVCLDGSPPGYHLRRGFGKGVKKWVVFFNGGAWCYDEQACYQRSHSRYGSSNFKVTFSENGLYSRDSKTNPDFYNWNKIFIIYCDGSSFTGMREKPVYYKDKPVYFRGKAVLDAIIEDLLDRGIGHATDVLLTGSSAGSLAVLIHADYIRTKLSPLTKVRAISDSGYFVDLQTHYGTNETREMFRRMLSTHNATAGLHQACLKRMSGNEKWKCLFPQYFFDLIKTPVFVLQSAYDVWQIMSNLDVFCTIPSYNDILAFRSRNQLRATQNTREISPRKTIRPQSQKLNSISSQNPYLRTFVTKQPSSTSISPSTPRSQRVNNPGRTKLLGLNYHPSSSARNTFENFHIVSSQNTPAVRRSFRGRDVLNTQYSSWRNTMTAVRRNNVQPQSFKSGLTSQNLGQQNPVNGQVYSYRNAPQSLPAAYPLSASTVQTIQTYNTIPALNPVRTYNTIPAKFARFYRQKREHRETTKRVLPKLRQGDKELKNPTRWHHWQSLYRSPAPCTRDETETILSLRGLTLKALKPVLSKPGSGLFVSSCFEHSQASYNAIWKNDTIKGKSPRDAIADWYFEKSSNHIFIGQKFSFASCMP